MREAGRGTSGRGLNAQDSDETHKNSVVRLFGAASAERADLVAVRDDALILTYSELDARANALAQALRNVGVRAGARVALCHERSAITIVGALAVWKAGAAFVALDPAYPDARLEYMLRDAEVAAVLADATIPARLDCGNTPVIDLDGLVASIPGSAGPPDELVRADDVAYVIYTSGSTGEPKGVEVSHRNLVSLIEWHQGAFGVGETDRASVLASPAFDASIWEVWPYLTAGAGVWVPAAASATSPTALRDWLVEWEITISFVPTPMLEELLDLDWPAPGALRFVLTGGDVLHRRPAPQIPFVLVNNYGLTEATVVSTSGIVRADVGARRVQAPGIGRAIAGTHLHVLDDTGAPVPDGEPGELYIGGAGVAVGYVNRAEMTADRFVADPFCAERDARMYRTGDLVRVDADDEVYFLGRLDSQVQVRGHRVELEEIAAALTTHDAVERCVAVARVNDDGESQLVAYIVATDVGLPDRAELRAHVANWLPRYMVPTAFVAIDTLPVTPNGKLDRAALPAPGRSLVSRSAGVVTLEVSAVEAEVIELLAELLALDGIDKDDNFFELGGHSLMGAQLVARLEDRFDAEIDLLTIFDHPTAAGIASVIVHELDEGESGNGRDGEAARGATPWS